MLCVVMFVCFYLWVPADSATDRSAAYFTAHKLSQSQVDNLQNTKIDEDGENYAPVRYIYGYRVNDPWTGDAKIQQETRQGDTVTGYYSVKEDDGSTRHVHYTVDGADGFRATVSKSPPPSDQGGRVTLNDY